MHFPTWVDLKGQDSVPETVHHVVSRAKTLSIIFFAFHIFSVIFFFLSPVPFCLLFLPVLSLLFLPVLSSSLLLPAQVCSVDPITDVSWHKLKQQVKVCNHMTILQHCMYLTRLTVFITVIKLEVVGGTQVCAIFIFTFRIKILQMYSVV